MPLLLRERQRQSSHQGLKPPMPEGIMVFRRPIAKICTLATFQGSTLLNHRAGWEVPTGKSLELGKTGFPGSTNSASKRNVNVGQDLNVQPCQVFRSFTGVVAKETAFWQLNHWQC